VQEGNYPGHILEQKPVYCSLYSTESRPFAKPESGKIAVKVINHYGDEVLKVFEI